MNLIFFMGTAAELIKMYPVLLECDFRQISWTAVSSGQSSASFLEQWRNFGLPENKLIQLNRNTTGLKKASSAFFWFIKSFFFNLKLTMKLAPDPSYIIIVHGDTISTLLGSLMAKLIGRKLVHIESGLNSKSLFNPFPEEITRRICSRLADSKFAPNLAAYENLKKQKLRGSITNTTTNTMYETLMTGGGNIPVSAESYALVNIHRFENLISEKRFQFISNVVLEAAKKYKVIFVQHPQTKHKLQDKKWDQLKAHVNIQFIDRLPFSDFKVLLVNSSFVITDGGSNQEECFYLGKPCLVMRNTSERSEGLDQNALLCAFEKPKADYFFKHLESFRRPLWKADTSPSKIIINTLLEEDKNV